MGVDESIEELRAKRICFQCVGEEYLAQEIEEHGREGLCSYCGSEAQSWDVDELAVRVNTAFDEHYIRTPDNPDVFESSMFSDPESSYSWLRSGVQVVEAIEEAASIPTEVARDVQSILEHAHALGPTGKDAWEAGETPFASESYYEERAVSDRVWEAEWEHFERLIKTESRFFSREAMVHLRSVFGDIDKLPTVKGRRLVLEAGPGHGLKHLYRARVFQSDGKLCEALGRPDLHIGSPPALIAAAGRMNARGISVFYGATKADVATAEVRPPVGSKVAVASFEIIKLLRLLDLTALASVRDCGSLFDPTLKNRLERARFLQTLQRRITRPVMPDDEALEYVTTQAIADFLASENEPRFDGIVFASAQVKNGRNVVLFHKAARVEALVFPRGTEIEARTGDFGEDGFEPNYRVSEETPDPPLPEPKPRGLPFFSQDLFPTNDDVRDPTLRVDANTIEVREITSVAYKALQFPVARSRFPKRKWPSKPDTTSVSLEDF